MKSPQDPRVDAWLRGMGHDLRAPLAAARGFASLADADLEVGATAEAQEHLARLRGALDRALALCDAMLELGCSGRQVLRPCGLSPAEPLRRLASELKPVLEERGIELRLPEDPAVVYADPTGFDRVVQNLVQNAMQHVASVDEPLIRVDVESDASGATLVVADNGAGIPEQAQARIFDLFGQAHPSQGRPGGGIGLEIVRRIVEAHGGRVRVSSKSGEGARFLAFFPHPIQS